MVMALMNVVGHVIGHVIDHVGHVIGHVVGHVIGHVVGHVIGHVGDVSGMVGDDVVVDFDNTGCVREPIDAKGDGDEQVECSYDVGARFEVTATISCMKPLKHLPETHGAMKLSGYLVRLS